MGSISTIVGGLVTTLISIVVWLSISPKSHAPPHGPPQSDDDEPENDTGDLAISEHPLVPSIQAKQASVFNNVRWPSQHGIS